MFQGFSLLDSHNIKISDPERGDPVIQLTISYTISAGIILSYGEQVQIETILDIYAAWSRWKIGQSSFYRSKPTVPERVRFDILVLNRNHPYFRKISPCLVRRLQQRYFSDREMTQEIQRQLSALHTPPGDPHGLD